MEHPKVKQAPAPAVPTAPVLSVPPSHTPPAPASTPAQAKLDTIPPPSPANSQPRVKNTTRHWRALRNALLSKPVTAAAHASDSGSATASAISTGFFPIFPARKAAVCASGSEDKNIAAVANDDNTATIEEDVNQPRQLTCRPPAPNFEWLEYDMTLRHSATDVAAPANVRVCVHEKRKDTRVTIAELLSHKVNAGVDNTGNVRTWPSEPLLLAFLLRTKVCEQMYERRRLECASAQTATSPLLNCCELGSGMAGFASLGLLAHAPAPFGRVDITDGNPLSVQNLELCVAENAALGVFARAGAASVRAKLLRWERTAKFDACERQQFDLLLASDCLFFEDFHVDLAHTIRELLRPGSGRCFLLQPSRGGSMERFVAVAQRCGLCINRRDAFDADVVRLHAEYERTRSDYIPDVHLPVLLVVSTPVARED